MTFSNVKNFIALESVPSADVAFIKNSTAEITVFPVLDVLIRYIRLEETIVFFWINDSICLLAIWDSFSPFFCVSLARPSLFSSMCLFKRLHWDIILYYIDIIYIKILLKFFAFPLPFPLHYRWLPLF